MQSNHGYMGDGATDGFRLVSPACTHLDFSGSCSASLINSFTSKICPFQRRKMLRWTAKKVKNDVRFLKSTFVQRCWQVLMYVQLSCLETRVPWLVSFSNTKQNTLLAHAKMFTGFKLYDRKKSVAFILFIFAYQTLVIKTIDNERLRKPKPLSFSHLTHSVGAFPRKSTPWES